MSNPIAVLRRLFTPAVEETPPGTFSAANPPRPQDHLDFISSARTEPAQSEPLFPRISAWFASVKIGFQNMLSNFIALFGTTAESQREDQLLLGAPDDSDEDEFVSLTDGPVEFSELSLTDKIQQENVANIQLISDIWHTFETPGFAMFSGLLRGDANEKMIKTVRNSSESVVFLPAIIENRGLGASFLSEHLRQHFVVFVVDKNTGTVSYFDPQGKDISQEERCLLYTDQTPAQFAQQLKDELNLQGTTQSNLQKLQKNSTECGFYGSLFMGRMASGVLFADLTNSLSRNQYFGGNDGVKNALIDAIES